MTNWLPGRTNVDFDTYSKFSKDLYVYARLEAGMPDCRDIRIMETTIVGRRYDTNDIRTATRAEIIEFWTLDACGRLVVVAVDLEQRRGMSSISAKARRQTAEARFFGRPEDPTWLPSPTRPTDPKFPSADVLRTAYETLKQGKSTEAEDLLREAAGNGHPVAQFYVGSLTFVLIPHEQLREFDLRESVYWIARSAFNCFKPAQDMLGEYYATGMWLPKDPLLADMWKGQASNTAGTSASPSLPPCADDR